MTEAISPIGPVRPPWLSNYRVLANRAAERPDAPAIELLGLQKLTYRQLLDRVDACAAVLLDRGVQRGDRVAIMAGNRVEILEVWLACGRIGAVFVPLNPALRGQVLRDMVELSDPVLQFCEREWQERLQQASGKTMSLCLSSLPRPR